MIPENPLNQYPSVRKVLYVIQWVVSGLQTIAAAYFAASGTAIDDLPKWYVISLAVLPVLWTYLGRTAETNVNTTDQ